MIVGGSLFALVERKRTADKILRSKIQTGTLIKGYWKRDQKVNLRTLGTVFALSRNPLRLKIYEALGQGTVDGEFHENEFLPRNPSQKDAIKPGASENAG